MSAASRAASLKVMLVDDHPVVRAGYRRLLELEPDIAVIAECGDADDALRHLAVDAAEAPDVLVTDLAMTGRSGMELLRDLRQQHPGIRVLVFSMHDSPAIVTEAMRAGAAGFVTKASAPEELVQSIRRVARQSSPVLSSDLVARRVLRSPVQQESLTLKEMDVLRLLAAGDSVQAIADQLQLSPKTVSNYQTTLKHKLGATTAIELLRRARERGFVI